MDATVEERQLFDHVTCNMSSTLDRVTVPGALALDVIEQVKMCSLSEFGVLIK